MNLSEVASEAVRLYHAERAVGIDRAELRAQLVDVLMKAMASSERFRDYLRELNRAEVAAGLTASDPYEPGRREEQEAERLPRQDVMYDGLGCLSDRLLLWLFCHPHTVDYYLECVVSVAELHNSLQPVWQEVYRSLDPDWLPWRPAR